MRVILTLCAIVLMAPISAAAQAALHPEWRIAPDSRVRIVSPVFDKRFVIGSVVSATPDTLVFRADSESTSTAIPTASIVRIDVGFGKHTNKARGGVAGFIFGALAGAAIGFVATNARQHALVRSILEREKLTADKRTQDIIGEVLERDPDRIRQEMEAIYARQKRLGRWK